MTQNSLNSPLLGTLEIIFENGPLRAILRHMYAPVFPTICADKLHARSINVEDRYCGPRECVELVIGVDMMSARPTCTDLATLLERDGKTV
jgi:hypothetical protein